MVDISKEVGNRATFVDNNNSDARFNAISHFGQREFISSNNQHDDRSLNLYVDEKCCFKWILHVMLIQFLVESEIE